jgi:hypothetical protein
MLVPGFTVKHSLGKPRFSYTTASKAGAIGPTRCPSGTVCCGGYDDAGCNGDCCRSPNACCGLTCTNLSTDPDNCGACGVVCESGVCSRGSCECPSGLTSCSGRCVNLETDPAHCGSCGRSCNGGTCTGGTCGNCPAGLVLCGGTCVNLESDRNNCGSCGNACLAGVGCVAGFCQCPGPQTWGSLVDDGCVGNQPLRQFHADIHGVPSGSDPIDTCYCTLGPAGTPVAGLTPYRCDQHRVLGILTGVSGVWQVADGTCCNAFGYTACGTLCCPPPPGNAKVTCNGGCGFACNPGFTQCGSLCVNLPTDGQNCGRCGNVCPEFATCRQGACACNAGLTSCGGSCVNINTDVNNCGSCGRKCPSGPPNSTPVCVSTGSTHTCSWECVKGYTRCGNSCVDLTGDSSNCGSCGKSCSTGQKCCGGSCTTTAADPKNCGSCGNACPAGTSCVNGTCVCPSPQIYCAGVGCVNPFTDPNHCGGCNVACNSSTCTGPVCTAGRCQGSTFCSTLACPAGCDPAQDECQYSTLQVFALSAAQATSCSQNIAAAEQCSLTGTVTEGPCQV